MLYKIPFHPNILILCITIFCTPAQGSAQELSISRYGVAVLDRPAAYRLSVQQDSLKKMLELRSLTPGIMYDLRYASRNNFMRRAMYPKNTAFTFLRAPAARALAKVQQALQEKGLGLKIFDAYRPYSVSVRFWELVKDERYVANPAKGSGHNRGLAVDCTIIELASGKELDMGTGFDHFSDSAHHDFTGLPPEVVANRTLLKEVMTRYGFTPLATEWWHYYWPNDRGYEVLDISFTTLKKAQ